MLKINKDWQHLYKTARWQRIRRYQLAMQPLCQMCEAIGVIEAATVVDHIVPHKGNEELFWHGKLQSVCEKHHNVDCQQMECGSWKPPIGLDGWTVDNEYLNKINRLKHPSKSGK